MSSLIYKIGEKAGRSLKKGQWIYKSVFGSEGEGIRAEYILGQELTHRIIQQTEGTVDPNKREFVRDIGQRLSGRLSNQQRKWQFNLLPSPEVNAFAFPGGFIFTTDTLLEVADMREAELAFILGHEIGHVVRGHPFDRVMADSSLKVISRLGRAGGIAGNLAKQTLSNLLRSNYSQDQELDADLFGVQLIVSAGYRPYAALNALQKLARTSGSEGRRFHYFSTHPRIGDRLREIQYHIRRRKRRLT